MERVDPSEGRVLSHYRLERRLGAGGMGAVYLALDLALGRQAAIKILTDAFSEELKSRLSREAVASARLQHPGIATFYEAGEVDGDTYIAMEYVKGRTLRSRLKDGALPAQEAVEVVSGLLEALGHAHAAGVIHRDIKPENIMITPERVAKLLDFGLAKQLETFQNSELPTATALTQQGIAVGTVGYMSPEQLKGEPIDQRTDIFAVGAVFYEILTGRPAFPGQTAPQRIAAILATEPPLPSGPNTRPELVPILMRALARNPSERYAKVADFLAELRGIESRAAVAPLPDTVAVIDFQNVSGNPEDDWIGSGMAETLGTDLASLPGIQVLAREKVLKMNAALESDRPAFDAVDLGQALGSRLVLSGGYQRVGPALRVTMRMTDVPTARLISTEKVDGSLEGIFEIQDKLSLAARNYLNLSTRLDSKPSVPKLEAYECYSRARRLWYQLEKGSLEEAQALYERAVRDDPQYTPALTGLASLYSMRFTFTTSSEDLDKASESAHRALEIDPYLSEPHVWLGYVYLRQWQLEESYQEECQAMELEPSAHFAPYFGACALLAANRCKEALKLYQRAVELDGQWGWAWLGLGWTHLELGNFSEARWSVEQAVEKEVPSTRGATVGAAGLQGEVLRRMGLLEEARSRCLQGLEAVEKTDHMYRDTARGICLCALGRTALEQDDAAAATAAFRQAVSHFEGRPRALGGGYLLVQALAGLSRAGMGGEYFERALQLLEKREGMDFSWFWLCSDGEALLELSRAAAGLGRIEEAERLLERARESGATEEWNS